MLLDRQMQSDILHKLLAVFPDCYDFESDVYFNQNYKKLVANLYYLQQHQLISQNSVLLSDMLGTIDRIPSINKTEITHKGIDFLLDDGGLSAILNLVTIKLEQEQFKSLLEIQILNAPNLSDTDKNKFINHIKSLPANAVSHLMQKLIDNGIDKLAEFIF